MELTSAIAPWHWFVMALALFALEVFASTGFFIGIAAASLIMSAVLWFLPGLAWEWQLSLFGLLSVVLTVGYFRFFRRVNEQTDSPLLNDRAAQLVGHCFTLAEDLPGAGSVMINDTRWHARAEQTLTRGTAVEVIASQGMTLVLGPATR